MSEAEAASIAALDRLAPRTVPLAQTCAWVEAHLLDALSSVVQRRVDSASRTQGKCFRSVSPTRFYVDDHLYEARVTPDPLDAGMIHVGVCALDVERGSRSQPDAVDLPLDGLGRFTTARLWVNDDLGSLKESLAAAVSGHFAGGYRWLESHVVGELLIVEHRATVELYMEIRSNLAPNLADLVALYGMDRHQAFYLLDPRAIQTALTRAAENRSWIASSPIELTTLLTTQLLDPEETVAQASLVEDRALSLRLSESRYAPTELNLAEDVFYESSLVVSLPLVREGRIQLTAVFPSDLRLEVEPVLTSLSERCREILQRNGRFAVRRIVGRGRDLDASIAPGDIAELFGRFAGGYVDSQH